MKKVFAGKVYWIAGTLISFTGVAMVRLMAPGLSGILSTITLIAGYVLSLAGIIIITYNTRGHAAGGKIII